MSQNLLAAETSPYLLQHRDNPVHWQPWGEAALALAEEVDRPILLSIGYAACHWCHVMAHESFEDAETAALMNAHFVNIKVDREERPDVDRIYMQALQALGEQGGWPLTMFLTPAAEPFWGGTYFPPEARYGRPGFRHVLTEIARIWREERHKVAANAAALRKALSDKPPFSAAELDDNRLEEAAEVLARAVDPKRGGLAGAPKFPQAPVFSFLWTMARRRRDTRLIEAVTVTLRHLCQGGIYDHLGGGIARYAVDADWRVPHFEKMLYDNAQFLALLTRVWCTTREDLLRIRAAETATFLLRDMATPEGAFAASYDADSEGEEGRYYVWSDDEIRSVLGGEADLFCRTYEVTPQGNWEGRTILNRLSAMEHGSEEQEARLADMRRRMFERRARRVPPGFDDKVLADWNGLAIAALADAALVFHRRDWAAAAARAFAAVTRLLWIGEELRHSWRAGQARHHATAEGYANLVSAALALYRLTAEASHLAWAERLAARLMALHWDEERGGLLLSSIAAKDLILRQRSAADDATPNANGTMLGNLARLHLLTGKEDYGRRAAALHRAFAAEVLAGPFGHASFLEGFVQLIDPVQAALAGAQPDPARHPLLRHLIGRLGPDIAVAYVPDAAALHPDHPAYGKAAAGAGPRLYLCRGPTCAAPAASAAQLDVAIDLLGLNGLKRD